MTVDSIKKVVADIADEFNISKAVLFGSRADGTNREDSDVDIIAEFAVPVSLLTIAEMKYRLEDALGLSVDVVHGPLKEDDIIEVKKEILLYTADCPD